MCSYFKLGQVVQEGMSFKEKVYGRMNDGQTEERGTTDEDRSQ